MAEGRMTQRDNKRKDDVISQQIAKWRQNSKRKDDVTSQKTPKWRHKSANKNVVFNRFSYTDTDINTDIDTVADADAITGAEVDPEWMDR